MYLCFGVSTGGKSFMELQRGCFHQKTIVQTRFLLVHINLRSFEFSAETMCFSVKVATTWGLPPFSS